MKRILAFGSLLLTFAIMPVAAQRLLTLDSCRAMALRNNKQLSVSKVKQDIAANLRRSARTKYLPHVSAIGTYMYTSEPISILSNDNKELLSNLGTGVVNSETFQQGAGSLQDLMGGLSKAAPILSMMGINEDQLKALSGMLQQSPQMIENTLNGIGQKVVDALDTDTRNIWAGSIMLTQPVFMGGSIIALNRLADINEKMARNSIDAREQATIYATDKAYWQVVSLRHKPISTW